MSTEDSPDTPSKVLTLLVMSYYASHSMRNIYADDRDHTALS